MESATCQYLGGDSTCGRGVLAVLESKGEAARNPQVSGDRSDERLRSRVSPMPSVYTASRVPSTRSTTQASSRGSLYGSRASTSSSGSGRSIPSRTSASCSSPARSSGSTRSGRSSATGVSSRLGHHSPAELRGSARSRTRRTTLGVAVSPPVRGAGRAQAPSRTAISLSAGASDPERRARRRPSR